MTFLTIMGQTGLFEAERVKVATAVSWFYRGADGGFEYWPDGPGGASVVHEGAIHNTGIVGDNDFMWHRVRPVGRPEDGMATALRQQRLLPRPSGHGTHHRVWRSATLTMRPRVPRRCSGTTKSFPPLD